MKKRMHQIELFMQYPVEVQHEWFVRLLDTAKNTEWGKKYGYVSISSEAEYKMRVPVQDYDEIKPYIDRLRKGEQNVLWPGEIRWFAKSSGTSGSKSKFIPVSQESLNDCHFKGGKDMLTLYCNSYPQTHLFDGKHCRWQVLIKRMNIICMHATGTSQLFYWKTFPPGPNSSGLRKPPLL